MSNEELAVLIQNGDRERELELWEQVRRFAMKLANKWLAAFRSRSDVEFDDLMSAAYIAMCEAVATYKPDSGSFIGGIAFILKTAIQRSTALERGERQMTRSIMR